MLRPPSSRLTAIPILTLYDLGLGEKCNLDQASRGLAQRSEAQIVRWIQFPAGALFFTLVPGAPQSGAAYVLDRKAGVFYLIDFNDQKWEGHSLAEFETLERTCGLARLAQRPWLLTRLCNPRKTHRDRNPFAQILNFGYVRAGANTEAHGEAL